MNAIPNETEQVTADKTMHYDVICVYGLLHTRKWKVWLFYEQLERSDGVLERIEHGRGSR
jgi:hypothetical protein